MQIRSPFSIRNRLMLSTACLLGCLSLLGCDTSEQVSEELTLAQSDQNESSQSFLDDVVSILDNRKVSSEMLLSANGNWNMVEQEQEYDPAAEHLKARQHVDTGRRTKMASLSPHFDTSNETGHDGKFRVLRIQNDENDSIMVADAQPEVFLPPLSEKVDSALSVAQSEEKSTPILEEHNVILAQITPPLPPTKPFADTTLSIATLEEESTPTLEEHNSPTTHVTPPLPPAKPSVELESRQIVLAAFASHPPLPQLVEPTSTILVSGKKTVAMNDIVIPPLKPEHVIWRNKDSVKLAQVSSPITTLNDLEPASEVSSLNTDIVIPPEKPQIPATYFKSKTAKVQTHHNKVVTEASAPIPLTPVRPKMHFMDIKVDPLHEAEEASINAPDNVKLAKTKAIDLIGKT